MAVKINFIDNGRGIEFLALKITAGEEIIEINKQLYNRDVFSKVRYIIIDRTNASKYNVSSDDIKSIAKQLIDAAKINPNMLIAIVSKTPLQYGMSRMLEAYAEESEFEIQIFDKRKNADNWIGKMLECYMEK